MGGGLCVDDTNTAPSQLLRRGKALAADKVSSTVTLRDSNEQTAQTHHTHQVCQRVCRHSLGCAEGRLKVLPAVAGA